MTRDAEQIPQRLGRRLRGYHEDMGTVKYAHTVYPSNGRPQTTGPFAAHMTAKQARDTFGSDPYIPENSQLTRNWTYTTPQGRMTTQYLRGNQIIGGEKCAISMHDQVSPGAATGVPEPSDALRESSDSTQGRATVGAAAKESPSRSLSRSDTGGYVPSSAEQSPTATTP